MNHPVPGVFIIHVLLSSGYSMCSRAMLLRVWVGFGVVISGIIRWAAVPRAVKDRQWFHLKSSHPLFVFFCPWVFIQCMVRAMRVLLGVFRVLVSFQAMLDGLSCCVGQSKAKGLFMLIILSLVCSSFMFFFLLGIQCVLERCCCFRAASVCCVQSKAFIQSKVLKI